MGGNIKLKIWASFIQPFTINVAISAESRAITPIMKEAYRKPIPPFIR